MNSHNIVCIHCRILKRGYVTLKCSICNKDMVDLGYRYRIPKKRDDSGWKQLLRHIAEHNPLVLGIGIKEHEAKSKANATRIEVKQERLIKESERVQLRKDRKLTHLDKMKILMDKTHS